MLWHYFALTVSLERVAAAEMAAARIRKNEEAAATVTPQRAPEPEPEFAWG
jgi:hypothetical protein